MENNNLPIKLVLQKDSDIRRNTGGGSEKFFGEVNQQLKTRISNQFGSLLTFYEEVFAKNENVPAVGKITMKPEAIAKSHKPTDLCRNCPIIGSEDLDEIYIKVTKKSIMDTQQLINQPPSKKFLANMTAIIDINPIKPEDKISKLVKETFENKINDKKKIKIKLFDFDNEFDNTQIQAYIRNKLQEYKINQSMEEISYGNRISFWKVEVQSYEDIIKLASINGIKSIDFFQEYALPNGGFLNQDTKLVLDNASYIDSDVVIGIVDGGISDQNPFLKSYIIGREEYVASEYQNTQHGTFIASTIQYGNILNGIKCRSSYRFKFLDIVAIPNSNPNFGPTDTISDIDFMEIMEEVMKKYSGTVKIWNISLGIKDKICDGSMSDLGIFLDYIQDEYKVQIFVSIGNISDLPFREWPPQSTMGERDRLISPADSVRAVTVGSIALNDSDNSMVKHNEPSPFSRRGPGANYIVKPDLVDYGGNVAKDYSTAGLGIKGLDSEGKIVEGNGTSYAAPRVLQKFAAVYNDMADSDILLAKAMLIHSARIKSNKLLEKNSDNHKYFGFGVPALNSEEILQCSDNEVTLIFKQTIPQGMHLEMYDFPYPDSLIQGNKYKGEIYMTLVYAPIVDEKFGREYCRTNIDVSFGTYSYLSDGKIKYQGQVPLESKWDEKYERERVEHGFKWSPVKSYYRKISQGIAKADGWKLRLDMTVRDGLYIPPQEFVLLVTIKDLAGNDIYSEIVQGLNNLGYIMNNLETRYRARGK